MRYRVEKYNANKDMWLDFGTISREDAQSIIKGYKRSTHPEHMKFFPEADEFEGMYIRKGPMNFYTIEAE